MNAKKLVRIAICLVMLFQVVEPVVLSKHRPRNAASEAIGLCTLVQKPSHYVGRIIRLQAVLVENNRRVVDGSDPFLYDPRCSDPGVVVEWSKSTDASAEADALRNIRRNSNEFGVSRANVVLVGHLKASGKVGYGHLGWAHFLFVIDHLESAEPVPADLPWPKRVEQLYRKKIEP